jgi:hypothetical protein
MYQKVGMFGSGATINSVGPDLFLGDQVRGFGFSHDGSVPTMFRFNSGFDMTPLNPVGLPVTPEGAQAKRNMEQFMLAFDTNLAPIVGQQVTLTAATRQAASPRIDLLRARANAGECDLVAKGRIQDEVGFLYLGDGRFQADRQALPPILDRDLRRLVTATGAELTYIRSQKAALFHAAALALARSVDTRRG